MVAITGAARGLGHALALRLAASPAVRRVIAIDDHRGDVVGVTWRLADVRDPALAGRLTGVDVLVHTDIDMPADTDHRARRAFNVRAAQTVLTAAAAGRVGRVVLVTSAMVYGAGPDNPVPLAEDAPLGVDHDGSVAGDLLEIEHLARALAAVAPGHGDHRGPARRAGRRGGGHPGHPALRGAAAADREGLRAALAVLPCRGPGVRARARGDRRQVTGAFAVGCDGWLEQEEVEELSGLRRIELPAGLTFGTAQRLHRIGITPAPVSDLRYVVYPWVVDCAALREVGLAAVLRQRGRLRGPAQAAGRASRGGRAPSRPQGGDDHRGRGHGGR